MRKRSLVPAKTARRADLTPVSLQKHLEAWLLEGEVRPLSPGTLTLRRILVGNFLWFLREKSHSLERTSLLEFLAYLSRPEEEGRWESRQDGEPLQPKSIKNYYVEAQAFLSYLIAEGVLHENPMQGMTRPKVPVHQIQPFTRQKVLSLLAAAKEGKPVASRKPRKRKS